ncbi:VIT1/CCC1 transporter family protein [Microbacterium immunditiarum]|uniref:VIT1/CCC1 family predicted Fe2+/Mn2+ transporter n=1 Tax=Microbacterium immunditiarum TaxID=337480 RepID=A0A7Y9KGC8_9MICO|nr:VIT1/CCC1 transporter family protein [Microbacterium immunditiarum]NYE18322.1 VIT1/CCC1 family predicted Fe2+/Mn2+ transporter [Microbacterium immunditiarum]
MAAEERSLWRRMIERIRETSWAIDANDGIIATAGLLQGFAGAGAGDRLLMYTAIGAMLAGGLSAGGAKWAEVAAEREAQLTVAREEAEEIEADPAGELAELAAHWESRGLSPELAHEVAQQLTARDALAAQLDAEHGLEEVMGAAAPWWAGVETAIAFMIGAAVPLLITFLAPVAVETWAILAAVVASLALTSLVAAGVGRLSALRMLIRSLAVGLGTMGISYLAGMAFF